MIRQSGARQLPDQASSARKRAGNHLTPGRRWNRRLIGALASLTLLAAAAAQASTRCTYVDPSSNYSGYLEWCRCIGGTPYNVGTTQVGCRPTSGGASAGGGISAADPLYQLGFQLGSAIGRALFGDPQEAAQRRAEAEAAQFQIQMEQARHAAEQARIAQERYQRIMASLKGVDSQAPLTLDALKVAPSAEPLPLKSGTTFFKTPANPPDAAASLEPQLKLKGIGQSDGVDPTSVPAQLNSATFLSQQATRAVKAEDAQFLANAAFDVVIGDRVELAIPEEVRGIPVAQANLDAFSHTRQEFTTVRDNLEQAHREFAEKENKKRIADELRKAAEQKLQDARSQQDPPPPEPLNASQAQDDKLAEAQRLLDEAIELDNKMIEELQAAKDTLAKAESDYDRVERKTRDFARQLGGDAHVPATTQKN